MFAGVGAKNHNMTNNKYLENMKQFYRKGWNNFLFLKRDSVKKNSSEGSRSVKVTLKKFPVWQLWSKGIFLYVLFCIWKIYMLKKIQHMDSRIVRLLYKFKLEISKFSRVIKE